MLYIILFSAALISLFAGWIGANHLLTKCHSNKPGIICFTIGIVLCAVFTTFSIITAPEKETEDYKYCPYCAKYYPGRNKK